MKNTTKLHLIAFITGLYFYTPIITLYLLGHDVTLASIIVAQSMYTIAVFLCEYPTGILADMYGQRASLIFGYLFEGLGIAMLFFMPNTVGLFVSYILRGLAGSFMSGSDQALLFESAKVEGKSYQKEYAKFLSYDKLAFAFSTFATGIIVQFFHESSYNFLILLSALCFFVTGFLAKTLKNYTAEIRDPSEGSQALSILKQSIDLIWNNKTIFMLMVCIVLTHSGQYFLLEVYQPYFQSAHVPVIFLGWSLTIASLLNVFVLKYSHLLEKYFTLGKVLWLINGVQGIAYILMAVFVHPIFTLGIFIFLQGVMNAELPVVSDYINHHTSSGIRSSVLSGVSFIKNLFKTICYFILAALIAHTGISTTLFIQGVYLFIGATISYLVLRNCNCTEK